MLNRLTIGTKIAGAFGVILLVVIALGLTAMNRLSAVNDRAADMRDNWLPSVAALGALIDGVDRIRVTEARVLLAESDGKGRPKLRISRNARLKSIVCAPLTKS